MRLLIYLILLMLIHQVVQANDVSDCKAVRDIMSLYNCLLENHPSVKTAQLSKEAAKASRDMLTQFPNPEVSVRTVKGDNAGENVGSTEVEVSIDLTELLVKRHALSSAGRSEEKLQSVNADEEIFRAKAQIIKDLFRYRQLLNEVPLTSEALETFGKIASQYRSRKARGPEQEITLNLVELAQGDYQLKKNHLAVEKTEIETRYKSVFGPSFQLRIDLLPALKKTWPEVTDSMVSLRTFNLRRAEAEKERADAEKRIAIANALPKIAAGPTYERVTEGPTQYNSSGFNVNVSVPIFSLNGGAREYAEKSRLKAQYAHEYALKSAELEKQLILQKYRSAVDSLKKTTSSENLNRKHDVIDSYFRRGLTSGSVVIEAHRQILEFTESQHEHETTALEALMYLNVLSGKDISEVLK